MIYICNICRLLDGKEITDGLLCPIDFSVAKCSDAEINSFFDNRKREIVITHQICNARQHGCMNDCIRCIATTNFDIHVF